MVISHRTSTVAGVRPPPPPPPLFGTVVTETETFAVAVEAFGPVQVILNVVSAVKAPVACEPEVADSAPLHPDALGVEDAVQLLVLLEVHVSVVCAPDVTLAAPAANATVAAGITLRPYRP
jgi:hypothetical protein